MFDPFVVRAIAKALVLPPGGPLLVALAGVVMLPIWPRADRLLAAVGVLVLLALSLPLVAVSLTQMVNDPPAFDPGRPAGAEAIAILGGGTRHGAAEYGGDTLGRLTLERVRYGARLARQTGLPVLVTGGSLGGRQPVAALMRESLEQEYGVAVRWIEPRARNTFENARFAAEMFKADGVTRVIVVAHAIDMPRAIREFHDAGMEVLAAPTGIPSRPVPLSVAHFVPSAAALQSSHDALYEMLANLVQPLRHRTP